MSAILDANVLLRYLTGDDPAKAARCEQLFRQAAAGQGKLRVTDVCLAEVVWTLGSYYGLSRTEIANKLVAALNTPGFEFSNVRLLLDAAERSRAENVDYIDAYHAAVAADAGAAVYSCDRDFDRFDDVTREEP